MTTIKRIALTTLLSIMALPLLAHEYSASGIQIAHPWARPTPPVEPINSAVYLTIENHRAKDLRLVGASTPVSEDVSIHRTQVENGMMQMKALPEGVVIKAGGSATFEPGGLHIMLKAMDQPLKEGDRFPLELSFEGGDVIELEVYVEHGDEGNMEGHSH